MEERLHTLRLFLKEKKLDAVLISSPANIVYFSGFSGFSSIERDGYILITQQAGYILTSPLYATAIKEKVSHLVLQEYMSTTPLHTLLEEIVKKHQLTHIGCEEQNLTVSEWKYIKKYLPKLSSIRLDSQRVKKTQPEIAHLRKAAVIADAALKKIILQIKPGIIENELVFMLENEIRISDSDIAFPTIVAFGKNAATPHHKSNSTKLKKNDLILIDFGATSHEYRSDMTRTFFMGKATDEQKNAYKAVLESQKKAVDYISQELLSRRVPRGEVSTKKRRNTRFLAPLEITKIRASTVDKAARGYLVSQDYPSIPHSLGHGIGLDVHEAPRLSPTSKEYLEDGMVFSIEPGVYFPDKFGIRIEDLYAIQKNQLIRLTKTPSTLLEL